MKKTKPTTLIGFFTRGREIGYVVMDNGQLVRYGVKTIKGRRQGPDFVRRVEDALASVLNLAGPHATVVIERRKGNSHTGALCRVVQRLLKRRAANRRRCYAVRAVSLKEAKQEVCGDGDVTNRELSEAIIKRHPILWALISSPKVQQVHYRQPILLVTALAELAWK